MQGSRLFQTIVVVGAALTGTAAGTALVAATALLSDGCHDGTPSPGDMPPDSHDFGMTLIDMQQDPRDLSTLDGGGAG